MWLYCYKQFKIWSNQLRNNQCFRNNYILDIALLYMEKEPQIDKDLLAIIRDLEYNIGKLFLR